MGRRFSGTHAEGGSTGTARQTTKLQREGRGAQKITFLLVKLLQQRFLNLAVQQGHQRASSGCSSSGSRFLHSRTGRKQSVWFQQLLWHHVLC